jgi:hypothetical protein
MNVTTCRVIMNARYNGTFHYKMVVLRKITKIKLTVKVFIRPPNARNFNQLMKFDYPDACDLFKSGTAGPNFILNQCMQKYPQLCHKCPWTTGVVTFNHTMPTDDCPKTNNTNMPVLTGFHYPDGEYKITIDFYFNGGKFRHFLLFFVRINLGDKSEF